MTVRSSSHKWTVRILLMVMVANIVESSSEKVNLSSQREKEIELRLKQLNKQPLKSIESLNGEIIDCISITKQIAFDHPHLKNHTIQMKPSFFPVSTESDASDEHEDIAQPWRLVGDCPENTIPIKRVTREDLLRVENYGKKINHKNISNSHQLYHPKTILGVDNGHEYAIAYVNNVVVRGAKAKINIWKPKVQESGEFSISQIWVLGGNFGSTLNSVEAGSMVNMNLHRDANPRLFIYWTSDGYQSTGCYNHLCPGFVQTNKRVALGALLKPISTYNGQQFVITVQIWKDQTTGNWWLQYNEKEVIGYWPSELLPNLRDSANEIEWGGEIVNQKTNEQHTTTEMGSGHFPNEDFGKASYFKVLKIVDMSNVLQDPEKLQTLVTQPTCYDLKIGHGKIWKVFFYYGGPGRNPRCP